MAVMGSWNGLNFEVSPSVVRGFTGLTIKGSSETKDTVSGNQKYVQRKNSAATEITLNIYLNAYLGCSVRDEAIRFITMAMEGESNYFYVGGSKLVSCKLMLISAEVKETAIAPNGTWIACTIGLTFKQSGKYDGISSGSSGSGSKPSGNKPSVGATLNTATTIAQNAAQAGIAAVVAIVTGGTASDPDKEAAQYIANQHAEATAATNAGKDDTNKQQAAASTSPAGKPGKPHFSVTATQ